MRDSIFIESVISLISFQKNCVRCGLSKVYFTQDLSYSQRNPSNFDYIPVIIHIELNKGGKRTFTNFLAKAHHF